MRFDDSATVVDRAQVDEGTEKKEYGSPATNDKDAVYTKHISGINV